MSDLAIAAVLAAAVLVASMASVEVGLSVALIDRLKKAFPNQVKGVKDSSGSWENTEALLKHHGDLHILIGEERLLEVVTANRELTAQEIVAAVSKEVADPLGTEFGVIADEASYGRDVAETGHPMRVSELLATLGTPAFIAA